MLELLACLRANRFKTFIVSAGLPFAELWKSVLINAVARDADKSPDFSHLIREGRPHFVTPVSTAKGDAH